MTDFEAIYEQYFRDVYRYALSLTRDEHAAEEITQEAFFRALKSIDGFDGRCRLYTWLCQIAKNIYFTDRQKAHGTEKLCELEAGSDDPFEQITSREDAYEIHAILHRLPEPYKEVFSLRTFGELPFRQIGELFGKTESWARVTYHRAKMKIREEME